MVTDRVLKHLKDRLAASEDDLSRKCEEIRRQRSYVEQEVVRCDELRCFVEDLKATIAKLEGAS